MTNAWLTDADVDALLNRDLVLLPDHIRSDRKPPARRLLAAWRAAKRSLTDGSPADWPALLMIELLRRQDNDLADLIWSRLDDEPLPRWVLAPPSDRYLQHVYEARHLIAGAAFTSSPVSRLQLVRRDAAIHGLDLESGASDVARATQESASLRAIAFMSIGPRSALVGITDDELRVLDVQSGEVLLVSDPDGIPRRAGDLSCVATGSRNGTDIAVTGTSEGHLLVWSLSDGSRLASLSGGHDGGVSQIAMTEGSSIVASVAGGSDNDTICFSDLATGSMIGPARVIRSPVCALAWLPAAAGWSAVTIDDNGRLQTWHPNEPEAVARIETGLGVVQTMIPVEFNGGWALAVANGSDVVIVDIESGAHVGHIRTGHEQNIGCLAASPSGEDVSSIAIVEGWSTAGRVEVVDLGMTEVAHIDSCTARVPRFRRYHDVEAVQVNDRRLLAVGSDDARIRLVDPHSGDIVAGPFGTPQRAGLQSMLRCGVVDGRPFAAVTSDSQFRIFHLDDGSQRTLVDENPERAMITGIACYHLSGQPVLVITDRWGNLQMWDVRSTRIRKVRAQAHPHGPTGLICVETDREPLLITGGPEGRLRGWSAVDLSPRPEVNAVHSGGVRGLVAGDKAFTSIGHDGSRKTWDANAGALLGTSTDAEPVVFEFDGERIVNLDGTLVRLAPCSSDQSSWPLGSWDDLPRTESLSFLLKLRGTLL